jgi:hypothetical protein
MRCMHRELAGSRSGVRVIHRNPERLANAGGRAQKITFGEMRSGGGLTAILVCCD